MQLLFKPALNLSYFFLSFHLFFPPPLSSSFSFLTHPQWMRKSLLWGEGLLDYEGLVFVLPPLVENVIGHNIQKHTMPQGNKA